MNIIKNKTFSEERALYNQKDIELINCRFEGEEDGESALKESENIIINDCFMDLRYPFWHDTNILIKDSQMTINSRAPLWYSSNINIVNTKVESVKALRECHNIDILDSNINSPEFGWRNKMINVKNSTVSGEYAFFESSNVTIENVNFTGKYSFQYVNNLIIKNSVLDTKDAFWHAKNVEVYDSTINGEYLAWYAENIKFVRCHIKGTQPICYSKKIELVDCTMDEADLAFEYSEVNGNINSDMISIKNPLQGKIYVKNVQEIIKSNDKYGGTAQIIKLSQK